MNEDYPTDDGPPESPAPRPADLAQQAVGASSIYRLCEEVIALREINNRQHKLFEQTLAKTRDTMLSSFNTFAADTYKAYQQMRQEFQGEKRAALTILNELLDTALEMEHIAAVRPPPDDVEAVKRWADAVEVQTRKVQAALARHGIVPYDAVIGSAYNPALHERVGSRRMEGMDALRVAEQVERGYASQQPDFVLRRPKVIITE